MSRQADAALGCAVAARCGGCPEFALAPSEQRRRKSEWLVRGLLERGVMCPNPGSWLVGHVEGYRARIRIAILEGKVGYFNSQKSPNCAVLEPQLLTAIATFTQWASRHAEQLVSYRVAEVRTVDADGSASIYLRHTQRNGIATPPPDRTLVPEYPEGAILAFEGGPVRTQRFWITPSVYARVPVGGFMQINRLANQRMVELVLDWVRALGAVSVLDLFAGSGNFTLPLAFEGISTTAVEYDAHACDALAQARREQRLEAATVVGGDAWTRARQLGALGRQYDVVIADPPRSGLRGEVQEIVGLARHAVVLVSCNAERFCTDAAALAAEGMTLSECVCVDMFPHTRHMEVLGLFSRRLDGALARA